MLTNPLSKYIDSIDSTKIVKSAVYGLNTKYWLSPVNSYGAVVKVPDLWAYLSSKVSGSIHDKAINLFILVSVNFVEILIL